jgi:hypothetical protein
MRAIEYRQIIGDRVHYWGFINGCFVGPITNQQPKPIHCQFTGLYDRNGVKIFEGDVLGADLNGKNPSIGVMEWDEESARWSMFHPIGKFEVIGNIHQNPELLESAS